MIVVLKCVKLESWWGSIGLSPPLDRCFLWLPVVERMVVVRGVATERVVVDKGEAGTPKSRPVLSRLPPWIQFPELGTRVRPLKLVVLPDSEGLMMLKPPRSLDLEPLLLGCSGLGEEHSGLMHVP